MPAAVFFDTETTGMVEWKAGAGSPSQPHIVQLGAILQDLDTKKVMSELNLLFQLPVGVDIHEKAQEVHKITPEMCDKYGVQPNTALRLFHLMLQRADLVVAHNMAFDSLVYEAAVLRNSEHCDMVSFRKCRPYCTMLTATPICRVPNPKFGGSFKWPTLKEAWAFFCPSTPWNDEGAHDAMYDVRACQSIYWGIQKHMAAQ